ncbi:MAG: efflux RND transporter periplasmic adaptor subunit [Acidobacteriota bacterium]
MNKKKLWIFLGGAAVVILIVVLSVTRSGTKAETVEVMKVAKGDIAPTVTADGLIAAKTTVNISSQVMGEIVALPFKEGQRVKKGDVLVRLNPDTYQRDVDSAKASLHAARIAVNQAEANLEQRRRDWDRAQQLFKNNIYSTQQRDDARLAFTQAKLSARQSEAQASQAQAAYERARDLLDKTILRSPIDGVVTLVNAKVGEQAVVGTMNFAGTVILTVADLSQIITEVEVDEVDLPRLRLGQPAVVTVDALEGKQYKGKVIEIGASALAGSSGTQNNIRQFKVKVAILDPDSELKPGITARVKLIARKHEGVLRVPIGCIRTEDKNGRQEFYVFTVKNGKVAKNVIDTGLSDNFYTEVTKGLKAGDEVITGPYRLLRMIRAKDEVKTKPAPPMKGAVQQEGAEAGVEVD